MNFQQLKYVVAVANNGSFREAAKNYMLHNLVCRQASRNLKQSLGSLFLPEPIEAPFNRRRPRVLKRAERILVQLESLEGYYLANEKRDSFSIASQHYDFLGPLTAKLITSFKQEIKQFRIIETTTAKVIEEVKRAAQ